MRKRSLQRHLFLTYSAVIVVCLLANGWLVTGVIHRFYLDHLTSDLKTRIALVQEQIRCDVSAANTTELDSLCKTLGLLSQTRITIIDLNGTILGDTDDDPALMENHSDRPEFKAAIQGTTGIATRQSPTLKRRMLYLAIPVIRSGQVAGVLRLAIPMSAIDDALYRIYTSILMVGIGLILLGAAISYWVSRRISRPIAEMKQGAQAFAGGNFERKIITPKLVEFGALSNALNEMAEQLHIRIASITRQRNELETVLSSMVEGVLALDVEERIIKINHAAERLLDIKASEVQGRYIQEVVPNPDLHRFVANLLSARAYTEGEIILLNRQIFIQVRGTLLRDATQHDVGALIVLNDITRIRRLENLRKEFVANVSHELRTPITLIKGFVETLQDGAIKDKTQRDNFLEIINKHVDRLNAIIEDLLQLSYLEQGAEKDDVHFSSEDIREAITASVQSCEAKAAGKNIHLRVQVENEAKAKINLILIEQALINLLENAIKYSPVDTVIEVGLDQTETEIVLYVRDSGCGIPIEHLSRIFERFYRVDKNRSREQGGTGLGLAIVKHIALVHHGSVSVESAVGKGSTFRIHIPR
ncbi:MAG: ATP-binding protein [bacterium]|nr:ATP-binding protein [bacterium]